MATCGVSAAEAKALGGIEVLLEGGEALYLPPYVWHEVSTVRSSSSGDDLPSTEYNVSFSVRLEATALVPAAAPLRARQSNGIVKPEPCALWIEVGRNVERLIAELVDAINIHSIR